MVREMEGLRVQREERYVRGEGTNVCKVHRRGEKGVRERRFSREVERGKQGVSRTAGSLGE